MKIKSTEISIENLKKRIGNKYDYSKVIYKGAKEKIKVICHNKDINGNEHGEFYITYSNLMSGYGCPKCGREKISLKSRIPYNLFQDKVNKVYGDNLYIVDKYTYENSPYEFKIYCNIHKIYFNVRNIKNFINKCYNYICPDCKNDILSFNKIEPFNLINTIVPVCEQPKMDENILNKIKQGEEVWVNVKNYENYYMVSSNGQIKKINRISKHGNKLPDIIIKQFISSNGRCMAASLNGKTFNIHKIVFQSFYNIILDKGYSQTIDHIDANPLNNNILNLRLCNGIKDNMLNNKLTTINMHNRNVGKNLKLITDVVDMENEIWKPIKGYENFYSISNKGRVKANERIIIQKNNGVTRIKKSHLMRLYLKDNKYYTVGLVDENGKHKNHFVHVLIKENF